MNTTCACTTCFCLNQSFLLYSHYKISPRALCGIITRCMFKKITNTCIPHECGAQLRKIGPIGLRPAVINLLKPTCYVMHHQFSLQDPCVLYIGRAYRYPPDLRFICFFPANISTEYFKHAAHSPSLSSKCHLFHNATFFCSSSIHILHTRCSKI